jgi:hypothetical protein
MPKPYAILGAGQLSSALWKAGDEQRGWTYRFNIYRMSSRTGHVSELLRPQDVGDLVKLCQVLAAILADDGCVPRDQRRALAKLAADLDSITCTRS